MAPRAIRPPAPFRQIVNHFRQLIVERELAEGDQLPTVMSIATEWGVAHATAAKAVQALAAEGLVRTSRQGTFVAGKTVAASPRDRIRMLRRAGRLYRVGTEARVLNSVLVDSPARVANALQVAPGRPVIRRDRVVYRDGAEPVEISCSWLPGEFAEVAPALLSTDRLPGGTIGAVAEATGRSVIGGRDQLCGRGASPDEAERLGLSPGAPVLAGTNVWGDDEGVIEFGEFVLPTSFLLGYEYLIGYEYEADESAEDRPDDPSP